MSHFLNIKLFIVLNFSITLFCFLTVSTAYSHPHHKKSHIGKRSVHNIHQKGKKLKVKGISGMRYNPIRSRCNYQLNPALKTTWQTYSPEDLIDLQDGVELGIRDKFDKTTEDAEENIKVIAKVKTPNGRVRQAITDFNFEDWAYVKFPFDFHKRGDFFGESGTYTVIWTTEEGKFLACDGFVAK